MALKHTTRISPSRTFGAFWKVGEGYDTTLILRNKDTEHRITAIVTLFSHEDKTEKKSQLQVEPDSVGRIALSDVIADQAGRKRQKAIWGSLMLEFIEGSASRTVGNLVIENEQTGIIFDLPLVGG